MKKYKGNGLEHFDVNTIRSNSMNNWKAHHYTMQVINNFVTGNDREYIKMTLLLSNELTDVTVDTNHNDLLLLLSTIIYILDKKYDLDFVFELTIDRTKTDIKLINIK